MLEIKRFMDPKTYTRRLRTSAISLVLLVTLGACDRSYDKAVALDQIAQVKSAENVATSEVLAEHATASQSAEQLYVDNCAACHDGPIPKAPHRILFPMYGPNNILKALTDGAMKVQASTLSADQKLRLAEHLGESKISSKESVPIVRCDADSQNDAAKTSSGTISSWGVTGSNTRFIDAKTSALNKDDISKLKLKWSFAYPDATRARSQPTVRNGVVYVGSQDGTVYALDLQTGCAIWTYKADAEVRSSVVISDTQPAKLYFGDFAGNIRSLNARDGSLNWQVKLDDHADVTITGTPKLHNDVLYVPLSSREWATAADSAYSCCTFRGGVVALNTNDGSRRWTSYVSEEPRATGEFNDLGMPRFAPSGAPVWNSPTIDEKRNRLYVGTGENYSSPATLTSDAVIAMDLSTGDIVWSHQATAGDAWNMACFVGGGTNCPEENGPDFDIGASTVLLDLGEGNDVLLVGQKSGHVFALDPAHSGKLLWKKKIGIGGFVGGVHWGMAADKGTLYAPIADTSFGEGMDDQRHPGLHSIDAITGEINWYTRTTNRCVPVDKVGCDPGLSAAVTAIPGAVFAGAFDGYLMAFDRNDGKLLWEYATDREIASISGEIAHGGSIESDGPVVVDGHVLVNSGYSFGGRMPGNLLLVFSVDGI